MNQEVKKWIDMAEMDYGVARHLFESRMGLLYVIPVNYS